MGWIKYWGFAVVLLFAQAPATRAQGWRKTMLAQVAALQGLIGTVEKGYQLAEEGVHLVRDIKSGELDLHTVFFGSLERVDAGVLESPVLAEARRYLALLGDRAADEEAALRVLTEDDGLTMTDGERMRFIVRIRDALRVKYGQVRRVDAVKGWIEVQRKKEDVYLQTLKKMYGLQ